MEEDYKFLKELVEKELEKKGLDYIMYSEATEEKVFVNVFPILLPKLIIFSTDIKYIYPIGLHTLKEIDRVAKQKVLEEVLGNIPFMNSYHKSEILKEIYYGNNLY